MNDPHTMDDARTRAMLRMIFAELVAMAREASIDDDTLRETLEAELRRVPSTDAGAHDGEVPNA